MTARESGSRRCVWRGCRSRRMTLKTMVGAEVEAVLGQRPDLQWSRLPTERTTTGRSSVACCPRASSSSTSSTPRSISAMPSMRPMDNAPKAVAQFEKYRHLLRYDDDGVAQVDSGIAPSASKHPECERIAQVLGYFRNNRHRMGYAERRTRDCLSAPGSWRRRARPWSLSGSSVRVCDLSERDGHGQP